MNSNEFSPHVYFSRMIVYWWVVVIAIFLGGSLGFVYFQLHPPVYEAAATFFVTLDLNRFPTLGVRQDLLQYNEDMALNTTEGALMSQDVLNKVISQIKDLGVILTANDLHENSTIERKHDVWELRYRSQNPLHAQQIVNLWAQIGYQAMLSWQASGFAPEYVVFQAPTLALIPEHPVLYGRNNLILAGALIGLVAGVILSSLLRRSPAQSHQEPSEIH